MVSKTSDTGRAIDHMDKFSYYGPVLKAFPIKVKGEDKFPPLIDENLKEHDTFACTDGTYVYFKPETLKENVHRLISENEEMKKYDDNPVVNIATVLSHEYTHIICQHHRIGLELMKKYKNKVPEPIWQCHSIACEIEANRGDEVSPGSVIYQCGVTDKSYPGLERCRYYTEIFEELLNRYNDNQELMNKLMNKLGEEYANKGNKGDGNGKDNTSGDGDGDKDKAQNKSQAGSGSGEETGNGQSRGTGQDDRKTWNITKEEVEQALKNMKEITDKIEADEGGGNQHSLGLDGGVEYKSTATAEEMYREALARWEEKNVKNELRKLKGHMRGSLNTTRHATYARPTRRPMNSSTLIQKGVRKEKSENPKVLIAMDSSGSMSGTVMKTVATAIKNIYEDLGKPKGSYICNHNHDIQTKDKLENWRKVVSTYRPSGGNDFSKVADLANKLKVDVVINIGDGQDIVCRDGTYSYSSHKIESMPKIAKEFVAANRKWVDVLVVSRGSMEYYTREKEEDENAGFHREGIFLGENITKYIRNA